MGLTFVYENYLGHFDTHKFEVDHITQTVASQTVDVLRFFGSDASQNLNPFESNVQLFYKKQYVARIVEGCNGMSVVILFMAFVIAFKGKVKDTLIFIFIGSLLIHLLNIIRIALLCVLIYHYPQFQSILHGVIFPLIIYGAVFLLWVIWVNKFSVYAKKA